eukprot:Gregarina_sp_Poly_1__4061@NODE_222_length_11242_cov_244_139150_g196_i0_p4_GENE_NODE_222_length_11242_cov_244_139150_g196_i0NODE_222_length_11242_cov_244_139150_g196_i0_p4_ORF_typecomplete_len323_score41_48zfISL3/PF14690_6/1_7e04zfISL3/PF14690_6/0_052Questin_oxidase/PF14027_6/0_11_NODE_222_length_11242_cov_244_139150_g196_i017592727
MARSVLSSRKISRDWLQDKIKVLPLVFVQYRRLALDVLQEQQRNTNFYVCLRQRSLAECQNTWNESMHGMFIEVLSRPDGISLGHALELESLHSVADSLAQCAPEVKDKARGILNALSSTRKDTITIDDIPCVKKDPISKQLFRLVTLADHRTRLKTAYVKDAFKTLSHIDQDQGCSWMDFVMHSEMSEKQFLEAPFVKTQLQNLREMQSLVVPTDKTSAELWDDVIRLSAHCFMMRKGSVRCVAKQLLHEIREGKTPISEFAMQPDGFKNTIFRLATPELAKYENPAEQIQYVCESMERLAGDDDFFQRWTWLHFRKQRYT